LNRVVAIIIVFLVTVIGGCSWQMAGVNMISGERLFRSNCRSCHTLPNPKSQTDSDWVSLVKRYGSQIDLVPEVQAKIIAYLQRVN
jgi:cytochrome c2